MSKSIKQGEVKAAHIIHSHIRQRSNTKTTSSRERRNVKRHLGSINVMCYPWMPLKRGKKEQLRVLSLSFYLSLFLSISPFKSNTHWREACPRSLTLTQWNKRHLSKLQWSIQTLLLAGAQTHTCRYTLIPPPQMLMHMHVHCDLCFLAGVWAYLRARPTHRSAHL